MESSGKPLRSQRLSTGELAVLVDKHSTIFVRGNLP